MSPVQNRKLFNRYQAKKRQLILFNFVIRASRYVIHTRLQIQNAEETADTIEWKNWINI
jgi:hypothetical protein